MTTGQYPKKRQPEAPTESQHSLAYIPTRKHNFDPNRDDIRQIVEKLPKGLVAVVANEISRYTAFHAAMASLVIPQASRISFHTGCYVVDSCNRSILGMKDDEDWLMFMGDDHVFHPMMLVSLLSLMYYNDLDVIVPLCFRRSFPPVPVLYNWKGSANPGGKMSESDLLEPINLNDHPKGGLVEVYAAGSAGMIIRKRVIDAMEPPWFVLGDEQWGEDLNFCRRARELGFKIWADLDNSLGHIINTTIWPARNYETGEWACEYDFGTQGGFRLGL